MRPDKKDKQRRHLTRLEVLRLMADLTDERETDAAREHLAACDECRIKTERLRKALEPRWDASTAPSPRVKERLIAEIRERQTISSRAPFPLARLALASAAAVILVVTSFLIYRAVAPLQTQPAPLQVSAGGGVTINGAPCASGMDLAAGDTIVTGGGSAMLRRGNRVEILVDQGTELTVTRALAESRSGALDFAFTLTKGALVCRSHHGTPRLAYAFDSPHARVESRGTEFLLEATAESTALIVREGSVMIRSKLSGVAETASEGKAYRVAERIEQRPIESRDIIRFESIERLNPSPKTERLRERGSATHSEGIAGDGPHPSPDTGKTMIEQKSEDSDKYETNMPHTPKRELRRNRSEGRIDVPPSQLKDPIKRTIQKRVRKNRTR